VDSVDNEPRGRLRALIEWLKGAQPPKPHVPSGGHTVPARLGHYRITGKLGEGGMGVVYAARDERLGRTVAIKTMSSVAGDETARKRFWREARAAASVSHPNICQIYEIGEDAGELYIAMELLEGISLSDQMRGGAISVSPAAQIGLGMLAALSALHARGIIHRDLKPSNVFITPHGVKLLDFGLARPELTSELPAVSAITQTGMLIGTPRYMAPELVTGDAVDARSDLFAAAAILFEMLSGRPAFGGKTVAEVVHATVYDQPPALGGSPAIAAVDRVIRRALAKRPADRLPSADVMAEELRAAAGLDSGSTGTHAHALTRLVVLPFRMLRPDPDTDFLAFSLPDAITTSLSTIQSLIVRSSAVAARFAAEAPDLKALASEADVDRVVMGTLLRSGDQVRAVAQLVEAPGGRLLTSHTVQTTLGDLFHLQDDIARRVVDALSLPLTNAPTPTPSPAERRPSQVDVALPVAEGSTRTPAIDAPQSPRAYELFLRANEMARTYDGLPQARELYEQCLELDPSFAPAWAQLGRCHRVIGKFIESTPDSNERAQEALDRAIALNPRLSIAHKFYAALEAEVGHSIRAMVRLVEAAARHGNDPELFAGLVHACRYCGLFDQSIAAHREARRLDPNVPTSLEQTLLVSGDLDRLLAMEPSAPRTGGADQGIRIIALGLAGERERARRMVDGIAPSSQIATFQTWKSYLYAWLDYRLDDMLSGDYKLRTLKIMEDPEAMFQRGFLLCDVGDFENGIEQLQQGVNKGYYAAQTLSNRSQFERVRNEPVFRSVLAHAEEGRRKAFTAFREAGGERLLGSVAG
jgi:eukaryotic-like serine/threonine-protein kinase